MKIYRGILKELGQLISRNRVVQQLQGGGVKGSFAIPGSGSKGRAAAVGGALGSQSGKDDE